MCVCCIVTSSCRVRQVWAVLGLAEASLGAPNPPTAKPPPAHAHPRRRLVPPHDTQGLYAQLLAGTGGTAGGCELSFEERMAACRRLAELLEEAAGRWGLPGAAQGERRGVAGQGESTSGEGWQGRERGSLWVGHAACACVVARSASGRLRAQPSPGTRARALAQLTSSPSPALPHSACRCAAAGRLLPDVRGAGGLGGSGQGGPLAADPQPRPGAAGGGTANAALRAGRRCTAAGGHQPGAERGVAWPWPVPVLHCT